VSPERVSIPEEAIEKAAIRQAGMAAGDEGQWRGYWEYAKAGLDAAAPLIVAASNEPASKQLMVLAQKITTQASLSSRSGQMQALEDIAFEVAEIARGLRGSASVLRGEEGQ
jgi:hypothetical protein